MRRLSPAFLVVAFVAAVFAFGNQITEWEPVSRAVFYVFTALFLISLFVDRPPKNIF